MIYLNPEVKSGLGEDTFWTWFHREFPTSSFSVPNQLKDNDVVLRYSTLGFLPVKGKQIALCWELYPDMQRLFFSDEWQPKLNKIYETARFSTYISVATLHSLKNYLKFGHVEVIPIGVNTDLFKPMYNKSKLREKYNLPLNKKIGLWIGTTHPMKGLIDLLKYNKKHPDIYWVCIWKWAAESAVLDNAHNFVQIAQDEVNELANAADFALFTSKIKPFYMAEWELMATDIPIIQYPSRQREFDIPDNPRDFIFKMEWDRVSVKQKWENFLNSLGVTW